MALRTQNVKPDLGTVIEAPKTGTLLALKEGTWIRAAKREPEFIQYSCLQHRLPPPTAPLRFYPAPEADLLASERQTTVPPDSPHHVLQDGPWLWDLMRKRSSQSTENSPKTSLTFIRNIRPPCETSTTGKCTGWHDTAPLHNAGCRYAFVSILMPRKDSCASKFNQHSNVTLSYVRKNLPEADRTCILHPCRPRRSKPISVGLWLHDGEAD